MTARRSIVLLFSLFAIACASQEAPRPEAAQRARTPGAIAESLYEPDVVLTQLSLGEAQRTDIVGRSRATQAELEALGTRLDAATLALEEVLARTPIDEEAAITAARAVTDVEVEIKLTHLRLLVQIRNALTPEQVAQLRAR